ncbi:hypothetical protein KIPB_013587, partial [Kipferlia bialata]
VLFGKTTEGYRNYRMLVPFEERGISGNWSPNPDAGLSKRAFDGIKTTWRERLHRFDECELSEEMGARLAAILAERQGRGVSSTPAAYVKELEEAGTLNRPQARAGSGQSVKAGERPQTERKEGKRHSNAREGTK